MHTSETFRICLLKFYFKNFKPPFSTCVTWTCSELFSSLCVTSLLPVFPGSLRHIRLLRPKVHEHADLVLRRPAHFLHHTQLPHRRRRAVRHPDETQFEGSRAQPAGSLQVGEVCLSLRHWQRWACPFWEKQGCKLMLWSTRCAVAGKKTTTKNIWFRERRKNCFRPKPAEEVLFLPLYDQALICKSLIPVLVFSSQIRFILWQ